jgi:hypothetical protein
MSTVNQNLTSNQKEEAYVMSKDSEQMSEQIRQIMEQEFAAQGNPSLRKFTDWLMENMAQSGDSTISHTSVLNWQNGKPPATEILEDMLSVYPISDRRFQFAVKLLSVKSPHVWGPGGVVWNLQKSKVFGK